MNINHVMISGNVVSDPRLSVTQRGDVRTSFRIAHNRRFQNRTTGEWCDGETTYVDVTCWRQLAQNVADSVVRGMPVVVTGRLEIRQVAAVDAQAPARTFVTVEAAAVGPDLSLGTVAFTRVKRAAALEQEARALADVAAYHVDDSDLDRAG
jgi:single-strand DNA-binding protein